MYTVCRTIVKEVLAKVYSASQVLSKLAKCQFMYFEFTVRSLIAIVSFRLFFGLSLSVSVSFVPPLLLSLYLYRKMTKLLTA